jgi:hypothetical protein
MIFLLFARAEAIRGRVGGQTVSTERSPPTISAVSSECAQAINVCGRAFNVLP